MSSITPKLPISMSGKLTSCEMDPKTYEELQAIPGNKQCIDCGSPKPDWGSPKLGILFCFNCSGLHRGLGTHVSFVRSVTMDSWTDQQIQQMKLGGNDQCKTFLTKHGIDMSTAISSSPESSTTLRNKYDTPEAEWYRQILLSRLEGRPEPTTIPITTTRTTTTTTNIKVDPSRLQGFGSNPLPPTTPQRNVQLITVVGGITLLVLTGLWYTVT